MNFLSISNVSLSFPASSVKALDNVNYDIKQGDFIILLGSNGSGKSSLLKLINREYRPTTGFITFLDKPLEKYQNKKFSRLVSSLSQSALRSLFTSLTVYENYLLTKKYSVFNRTNHKKEMLFLQEYLKDYNINLPKKLNTVITNLSGGEQQALVLALNLLHPPTLLLLDEHTSALDPKTSEQIMRLTQELIDKHKMTCVLTTHDLDIALHYGNRLLILHHGHIVKSIDSNEKQFITKEDLAKYY